jgi:histidinol-phosphate aminotransferase
MTYFRKNIEEMQGYIPGEQPKTQSLIKLNTNENPYPPSPKVAECLNSVDYDKLRLYPDPAADKLREVIAKLYVYHRENIIIGNGSDDILTIAMRSFVGEKEKVACFETTYSLYPVLAKIQNAVIAKIPLSEKDNFEFPIQLLDDKSKLFLSIKDAKLFFITRPNAPTGTVFDIGLVEKFSSIFKGIIFIDEAYADFAETTCIDLVKKYPNVIIGRTLSKSYSLAGIRLGWGVANETVINGMMKVKDSYNINYITQKIAISALEDQFYFKKTISTIKKTRDHLSEKLINVGFKVIPSQSNFIFVSPPNGNGKELFEYLRKNNILVRYFPGKLTGMYMRITIGTDQQIDKLYCYCKNFIVSRKNS